MNCVFISSAQWSPRSWSHRHMSPCRSSVRFPLDHESPCCDFAPFFSGVKKKVSTSILVTWSLKSTCFPPLGCKCRNASRSNILAQLGFLGHCWPRICYKDWSKPSGWWKNHRPLDGSAKHIETVALENPLDNMCVKIYLCVCVC